jgi:TPR repeat protein
MSSLGMLSNNETVQETWWRKAAALGEESAMYNLASLLLKRGDTASTAEAQQWVARITDPELLAILTRPR